MAIVGSAEIIVRAVTKNVKNDIKKGFAGLDGIGNDAGDSVGNSFSRGFAKGFGRNAAELLNVAPLLSQAEAARAQFASLQKASFSVGAALTALGGVIGSLIGGIGLLVITLAAAAPVAVGLINIFAAVAVSAGILRKVFEGVGEAISNQKKGTSALADAQETLADANLRVEDAQYALNELTKEQARDIADLEERVRDLADAESDAAISAERAERTYQNSVKATEKALEDVTKAREEAKEAIQQLRFELEGGVISEKKARLEFEKARDSLQRVQDLPPNSRARREAELAFAEADLNLRRAIDKNNDLRKSTAKANREGVDGNAKVIKAQDDLQKAVQNQTDAEIDAARAVRNYNEVMEDRKKLEAELLKGSVFYEKQRRALELAERAVAEATEDAAKAQKGLTNALKEDPYSKLAPAAKAFVDYIVSLTDRLEALRKKLQQAFFERFNKAAKLLIDTYLPILETKLPPIAEALGKVAEYIATIFTTPEAIAEMEEILDSLPILVENYGKSLGNLASIFKTLAAAFTPYAIKFSEYVKDLTTGWKETIELKKQTGELDAIFKTATEVAYSLFRSFGNIFGTIGNLIKATFSEGGGGWYFLTWLEQVTEKWEQFTKKGAEDGSLDKYILGLSVNFTLLLTTIGLIAKGFLDIAASEGFGKFLTSVNEAIVIFNEIGLDIANTALPAVGKFIVAFAKLTQLFFDAESIAIFFTTLTIPIEAIVKLLDNEFGRAIIGGVGALVAFGLAIGTLKQVFKFFRLVLLGSTAQFTGFFLKLMPEGSKAATILGGAMTRLGVGTLAAAAPVLAVVAAIALVIGILKLAYDKSEIFRKAVSDLVTALKNAVSEGIEKIKKALEDVIGPVGNIMDKFKALGDFLGKYIVPFFKEVLVVAINIVVEAVVAMIKIAGGIFKAFSDPVEGIKRIFGALVGFFKGIAESIAKAFGFKISWAWLTNGLESAVNFVAKGINLAVKAINLAIKGLNILNPFKDIKSIPEIQLPIRLAKGGIVPATQGGVIAMLGEAGRPERVEPLDSDGLSKRDKAMIDYLSSGSGGVNITVNPSPGMDERELASLVSRQLAFQLRKGAA